MDILIRSSTEITPAFLTGILRARGVLPRGEVVTVQADCATPFLAEVCTLTLTYTPDAPSAAPRRLFLKLLPGDGAPDPHAAREIAFYRALLDSPAPLPLAKPYHAAYDDTAGTLNLLLEDLSATHQPIPPELPPTEAQCYAAMTVLARLHAHWWDHPDLPALTGDVTTPQSLTAAFDEEVALYRDFADFLADRLLPSRRAIYRQVIDSYLPLKLARFAPRRNLTLSHGDAHAWNFLYPRAEADSPVLLDWEALGINLPAYDVAYFMTVFWHPSRRAWLERALVQHYHAQLRESGIESYAWEDCWRDYRLSVIGLLFQPVWWWKMDAPAFLWWHRLERIMLAFEDLDCASLLTQS